MKKILTTAVFAMALAMVANAYEKTVSTFEDGADIYFSTTVTPSADPDYSSYAGLLPSETTSTKYLAVSTDTALCRNANSDGTAENVTDNFYIDMMAQFNETESAVMDGSDKLALYMNVDGKLVVVADGGEGKAVCVTDKELTEGTWYRVIIRMISNIYASGDPRPGFVVSINGENVSATAESYENVNISGSLTPTAQEYYDARQLFPSILDDSTIQCLALTGVGSVDDIVFTDKRNADSSVVNPWATDPEPPEAVMYTIVDANGTAVGDDVTPKTVDYSALNTGVYSVQASANGKTATIVGDPIGVMQFDMASSEEKLISVPWLSADKKKVRVADMFVGAANNDAVSFYSNGQFWNYTYDATEGVWSPDPEAIAAGYTKESVFEPGTAARYRSATQHTIKLVGIAQDSTEKSPEAGVNTWSALGSTVATNTPVANILKSVPDSAKMTEAGEIKDRMAVQSGNGYKFYYIGKDGKVKNLFGGTDTTDDIAPGCGFMYFSTGNKVPTVKFGN